MTDSSDLKVTDEPMDGDETPTCAPKPYGPITQALRAGMDSDGWANSTTYCVKLSADMDAFNALCDDVDALHKALEDENATLREQNAKLRETVAEHARSNVEAVTFLDRLSDAVEKREDVTLFGVDYTALPLDADGVPIHVGDWITGRCGAKAKVVAVTSDDVYWWEPDGCHWCRAFEVRHYHAPTVEDVLRGVVTLCHNTWKEGSAFHFYDVDDVMKSGNIAEYAAKLRLAGDAE